MPKARSAERTLELIRKQLGADRSTDLLAVVRDVQDVALMTASEMVRIARGAEPFMDFQDRLHNQEPQMASRNQAAGSNSNLGQVSASRPFSPPPPPPSAANEAQPRGCQPGIIPPVSAAKPSLDPDLSQLEHDILLNASNRVEGTNQRIWELQELAAKTDPFDSSYVPLMRDLADAAHNYISACQELRQAASFR